MPLLGVGQILQKGNMGLLHLSQASLSGFSIATPSAQVDSTLPAPANLQPGSYQSESSTAQ